MFELTLDTRRSTLSMPAVLPGAGVEMVEDLRRFAESRQSNELPEHRRIDTAKAVVTCSHRGGNAGIEVKVRDGDYEYAVRKLIALVHEVYMVFLYDGRYYEYLVETFDLDPDHM